MSDLAKLFDTDPATDAAYKLSRMAFEQFAACALSDPMPPHPIDAIQVSLARWQFEKYGPNPDSHMALGMIEEGTECFMEDENTGEALDGLGDVCVYAAQLATNNRLAIAPVLDLARVFTQRQDVKPLLGAGILAQVVLKGSQRIRGLDQVERYHRRLVGAMAAVIAKAIDDVEIFHPQTIPVKPDGVLLVVANEVLQRGEGHPSIPTGDAKPIARDELVRKSKAERDNEAMTNLQQAATLVGDDIRSDDLADEAIPLDGSSPPPPRG
jgi:hypothetical protein